MGITRINNNIAALSAQRNINETGASLSKSIERLSSGLRINRAGDDAAGLSVANRLRTQSSGLNVAVANAQDGINVISVAEGALEESTNRLNRIRELAIQAANTGVNDFAARASLQDEVFQSIDEITRIAQTTQFGGNFLLNGDFSINSRLKEGVQRIGLEIDASPVASSLDNGTSFLNIQQASQGFNQIVAGDPVGGQQVLNTGIRNQGDIAVSAALFTQGIQGFKGSGSLTGTSGGDTLVASFFNGVSIASNDIIAFSGVLSDGVTEFVGTYSARQGAGTGAALLSAINESIDNAEIALFGVATAASVSADFRTTASLGDGTNALGRISFASTGNVINQSSIDVSIFRSGTIVAQSSGVTRSGAFGENSFISGTGQIGNSVQAITGSTFGSGDFEITVGDVQQAQQRTLESTITFRDESGSITSRSATLDNASGDRRIVLNGSFVSGVYTGGTSITTGSTITLQGTNVDGTTFSGVYTYTAGATGEDTTLNDFEFNSISGLINELNFRTRDYAAGTGTDGTQTRFENALFTFTAGGTFQLVDDLGRDNSQLEFTFTFDGTSPAQGNFTLQDDAELVQEGFTEAATFSIDGGESIRASAGDVVTLVGQESTLEGIATPEITIRIGSGLTAGTDIFETTQSQYTGSLNGGERVTFQAGDQDVTFFSQPTSNDSTRFVTIDFNGIIDATSTFTGSDAGSTVLISTVNNGLNFQIGANAGQDVQFTLGNVASNQLGFGQGSGRTVEDINITTLDGANDAINIVDEALSQINRTRSILGAATNRLESTVANLSVASENLTASESRIRDADIAAETTRFTLNQVLLQAGTSVLAQANFQSQGFLQLLG